MLLVLIDRATIALVIIAIGPQRLALIILQARVSIVSVVLVHGMIIRVLTLLLIMHLVVFFVTILVRLVFVVLLIV